MLEYGTQVVAGVTPGKGGEWAAGRVPVFDTCEAAVRTSGANCSVIYVPARYAADAIFEAVDAGIGLVVCITEGVAVQEMMRVKAYIEQSDARLIGPNCPGIFTPGEANVGIIPGHIGQPGNIGVVSRSGTLTYEVLYALKQSGMGTSTCVGIGGDPVNGTNFVDVLQLFDEDPYTEQVVMIGEIGGSDEERAADYISTGRSKPVVGFVAGLTAPSDKRMGHAGAIVQGGAGSAQGKITALREAGVLIASHPEEIPSLL
jgi:succinyl-CoA synthetase alpha subunit